MALMLKILGRNGSNSNIFSHVWPLVPIVVPKRNNRYNPLYLEPTVLKGELEKPLDDSDIRKYQPIKAARNEETSGLHYDGLVAKFIRQMLNDGDKLTARTIIDKTFENIRLIQIGKYHKAKSETAKENIQLDPRAIFYQAVENCKPLLITQKVKRGGVMYQVPIPVKENYQTYTAIKWLIEAAKDKERHIRMWNKLALEMLDASRNEGRAVRKKQELHRLCEANRAYAHYRW